MRPEYVEAQELAAKGRTNVEIFAALGLSVGEVKRRIRVDHDLIFAIVNGRQQFIQPIIDRIVAAQVFDTREYAQVNIRVCQSILTRYDSENRILGVGYETAIIENAGIENLISNLSKSDVTNGLRAMK